MCGSREQMRKKEEARKEAIENTRGVCADGERYSETGEHLEEELNHE